MHIEFWPAQHLTKYLFLVHRNSKVRAGIRTFSSQPNCFGFKDIPQKRQSVPNVNVSDLDRRLQEVLRSDFSCDFLLKVAMLCAFVYTSRHFFMDSLT